ncbi:hypothetical protein GF318_03465 [Candidatus Micrarchaeota archaeon]|nr:hypothetical protein [Candidatus Micrarchaeota archaeon]
MAMKRRLSTGPMETPGRLFDKSKPGSNHRPLINMARHFIRAGNHDDAGDCLQEVLSENPQNRFAISLMMRLYGQTGETLKAAA